MSRTGPARPFARKVRPRPRDRLAVVCVRQSSALRVAGNRESADLRYQLRPRAVTLGWADDRVPVIDDDRGVSGSAVENRPGFRRLLAAVSLGAVGVIFGREVGRRSRSCRDWHQSPEPGALFRVPIADAGGVHAPTDPSDRLLLGPRGTMSEAQLHALESRMHQGELNEARRGELFTCAPEGGIASDPDGQVRPADGSAERAGGFAPAVRLRPGTPGVRRAAVPERGGGASGSAARIAGADGGRAGVAGVEPAGVRTGRAGWRAVARALEPAGGAGGSRSRPRSAARRRGGPGEPAGWPANWSGRGKRSRPNGSGWTRSARGSGPSNRGTGRPPTGSGSPRWRRTCRGRGTA